jgi:putative ABC transport system ATP-binding protein
VATSAGGVLPPDSQSGANNPILIDAQEMVKVYQMGDVQVCALCGASLQVRRGETVAIMGASGSGKSTLMNILGCLDVPTSGHYVLEGIAVEGLDDDQLAEIRGKKIGFVFQSFNLLSRTSALSNVELPLVYSGVGRRERYELAATALEAVGLTDRMHHRPNELSGGQQQRVAIARALVNQPAIILADEPTGNLDSRSGKEIMAIFQQLNADRGITIMFVTHEHDIARHTRRIVRIADGRIVDDQPVLDRLQAAG